MPTLSAKAGTVEETGLSAGRAVASKAKAVAVEVPVDAVLEAIASGVGIATADPRSSVGKIGCAGRGSSFTE